MRFTSRTLPQEVIDILNKNIIAIEMASVAVVSYDIEEEEKQTASVPQRKRKRYHVPVVVRSRRKVNDDHGQKPSGFIGLVPF